MNPHGTVRIILGILTLAFGLSALPVSVSAAEEPPNLALTGRGILGLKPSLESGPETETAFYNSGTALSINDGDLNTRVDTYNGNGPQKVSFVGIIWDGLVGAPIVHLDLSLALFGNGGWFGPNEVGPSPGGVLTDEHLIEPRVEVSRDAGATWETVPFTSDYYLALRGKAIGAPNRVTTRFSLNQPAVDIDGIRIVGTEGGTVSGGFLGVFELVVLPGGADSDADGMEDNWETAYSLSVGTDDSAADPDGDGLSNIQEYRKSDPTNADTDGDGLSDGAEVNQHGTSPVRVDSDGDSLSDSNELTTLHTNPLLKDTDADGFPDGMEVSQGTDPTNASNYPSNIAIFGTGILGGKNAIEDPVDTELHFANSGSAANVNDGNLTSKVDTYGPAYAVSFVGVTWSTPVSQPVAFLDLTFALFSNGGWFGVNGTDPGPGGLLTTEHLVEPVVEITTDGGASWQAVPHTSDYIPAFTGQGIGGGANPNPNKASATFTLATPAANITGIRLVGTDGGSAGGGFLGVYELATRTAVADSDNDGMDDAWERANGLTVGTDDSAGDPDTDSLSNRREFTAKTDPQVADSDGDGLNDGREIDLHLTNPLRADTDGDSLSDGAEINTHLTNPLAKDTDNDGFGDSVEVTLGSDPTRASSFPSNIAALGRGILGKKDQLDGGTDSEIAVFNGGNATSINDANLNTRVDTYGPARPISFVGILWDEPVTNKITNLQLTLALFSNGGWFGTPAIDPGAGGLLTEEYLLEPRVEITIDGGVTWTVADFTSDYNAALLGIGIGGGAFPNPNKATATFTLAQPTRDINGIRLVGSNGGTAGGGFFGLFELAVNTAVTQSPTLLNVRILNGQFRFEFDSQSGVTHRVQFKTTVTDANWQTHTTIPGDGTRKQFSYDLAGSQRLFRVESE